MQRQTATSVIIGGHISRFLKTCVFQTDRAKDEWDLTERRAMFSDTFCSNTDESQHATIRHITKEMLAVEIP